MRETQRQAEVIALHRGAVTHAHQVKLTPVSYTHLDVYKRQADAVDNQCANHEQQALAQFSEPVSYTHLDVYKRQDYRQAGEGLMQAGGVNCEVYQDLGLLGSPCKPEAYRSPAWGCLLYTSRCV